MSFQISCFPTWLSFFHRLRTGESSVDHISLSNLQPAVTDLLRIRSCEMTWVVRIQMQFWRRINKLILVQKCDTIANTLWFFYGLHSSTYLITNHDLFKTETIPISKYRTYLSLIHIKPKTNKKFHIFLITITVFFNYNLKTNKV